ncbi:PREDICTED: WD repeat-containing protein 63-like, partial [Galeopterus variegatus]|uniref:WD repeat-containing protein 63-like n=1 Tax=Galeopterus variegatus TaxID=482537 RepID=A0ABM0SCI2_GALVR
MSPVPPDSPQGKKKGKKRKKERNSHPEIYPVVLTTNTQEIFKCRIDADVTEEQPYKLIRKEDIFEDLRNRAAVSDFYPVKKMVQEYPGDELVLVYDKDFRYGLNFYLIGTEEGKENYLNPPEVPEEQEEYKELIPEDIYIYKPPVSKPWVSLGSEKEIEEESVKESTKQITYMISRKRSEFGAPIKFSDQNASSVKDAYVECTAYPDKNFTLKLLEKDVGMQVVPQTKDTSTQTRWTYPKNATTQYYPREFSEKEKETLGQSKSLVDFLNNVSISVEIALQQNEIMNTFIDDWKCLAEEEGTFGDKTDTHLKEYQSFTDLHSPMEKMITCVSWHPTIYGELEMTGIPFCDDIEIIVMWDITAHADRIENIKSGGSRSKKATLKPMFLLDPESNKEAMYIRHCAVSSIESGHKKVITDIHWLSDTFEINRMGSVFENRSGICCQLVTCSADCTICFWDIRPQKALTPQPTEKKKEEVIEIPFDVPSTFLHLDLSWKPLNKLRLSKGETSLDHCPTKISLNEDHLIYKTQ